MQLHQARVQLRQIASKETAAKCENLCGKHVRASVLLETTRVDGCSAHTIGGRTTAQGQNRRFCVFSYICEQIVFGTVDRRDGESPACGVWLGDPHTIPWEIINQSKQMNL